MKEKRHSAQEASLFGFPVCFRIENRNGHETLILSYRDKAGKIKFESTPVRVNNWSEMTEKCWMPEPEKKLMLEALIGKTKAIEKFCVDALGIDAGPDAARRKKQQVAEALKERQDFRKNEKLPLGVLLLADREKYFEYSEDENTPPSPQTVEEREKAVEQLLRHEGYQKWKEVTPQSCAKWLNRLSVHDQKAVARAMRRLFAVQKMLIPDLEDLWSKWSPVTEKKKKSHKALVKDQIEICSLTDGQCSEIVEACMKHCRSGKATIDEFAVLLLMTTIIKTAELCALYYADFTYLKDYRKRLVMRLSQDYTRQRKKKNYKLRSFANKYKTRFTPLAHLVAEYYEALRSRARSYLDEGEELPEKLPVFGGTNKMRHLSPKDLEKRISTYMEPWMPQKISTTQGVKAIGAVELLQNTAEQHMRFIGYEDEEIRRMKGLAPLLTSAKSYQDFVNEAELNKLGSMTDLWLSNACSFRLESGESGKMKGKETKLYPDKTGGKTFATIQIEIQPMESGMIAQQETVLHISALHGFSGTITHLKNDKENEHE